MSFATDENPRHAPACLAGGGMMGGLMRELDWSTTAIDPPERWPQALRTMVRLMLNSGHPMSIWRGSDYACLYNDAYCASIRPERHSSSLGQPARIVWEEIWHTIGPEIDQVMSGHGPTWHENALVPITRHGRREDAYWTYSYSPIDDDDAPGGIGGVLVICSETTSIIAANKRVASERGRFARLLEQAPSFIAVMRGPEHRFEMVNIAYSRVIGDRNVLGRKVAEALPEAIEQGYVELLDSVYRTGKRVNSVGARYAFPSRGGGAVTERYIDFVYEPELDEDGRIVGVFCEGHDVTETQVVQAQLAALTASLQLRVETAVAEREQALARLHEVHNFDTLGQLTAGVAHDFNNLLTPIMGGIDLLARRLKTDAGAGRIADGAMRSAERARVLVQRLLAFGRRQILQSRAVDLASLIGGMDQLIRHALGPSVAVTIDISNDLPPVEVDPHQLELAVLNLCINAREAMPHGGHVTIAVWQRESDGQLSLSVTDDGEGMDEATLARAIEPYFTTKGVGAGTGLGLSMVHGLAAQSGGRLVLTSSVGSGTVAELSLPVALSAVVASTPTPAAPSVVPCRGTILLVDDEELVRMAIADGLRDLGYDVVEAHSAGVALEHLGHGVRPDLLVTDHLMPGMTGTALAVEARVLIANLPVMLITGYADLQPEETLGIDVMAKPFRQADFAQRVANLIASDATTN